MPTAMPRSGPALCAGGLSSRQTKAPIDFSCALVASSDCAIAASAERSPASMRRWRSVSEIMVIVQLGERRLAKRQRQLVLDQNCLVVGKRGPQCISQFIGCVETRRATPNRCTHIVGASAENVEAVALNQKTRKMAAWMSHDRGVRRIRVYFDRFNVHS